MFPCVRMLSNIIQFIIYWNDFCPLLSALIDSIKPVGGGGRATDKRFTNHTASFISSVTIYPLETSEASALWYTCENVYVGTRKKSKCLFLHIGLTYRSSWNVKLYRTVRKAVLHWEERTRNSINIVLIFVSHDNNINTYYIAYTKRLFPHFF